jgi:hypothetical protein
MKFHREKDRIIGVIRGRGRLRVGDGIEKWEKESGMGYL